MGLPGSNAVLAFCVLVLVGGCGDGAAATPAAVATTTVAAVRSAKPAVTKPAAKGSPCALVTGEDAAAVLGTGRVLTAIRATAAECAYAASNGLDTVEIALETERFKPESVNAVFVLLDQSKATRVDGLGDAAFSYSLGPLGTQMHVWGKGRYLMVTVAITSRHVDTDPLARQLAATALDRL